MRISLTPCQTQRDGQRIAASPSALLWLAQSTLFDARQQSVLLSRLSAEEARRYLGFPGTPLGQQRQLQFLIGRSLLRLAIASVAAVPATSVRVAERPGNAPGVSIAADDGKVPYFSLAHSKHFVACLTSRDTPAGLDIEWPFPQRDVMALSSAAFTAAEHFWLSQQPETLRQTAFYRLWNNKEAWYKLMSAQCKPVDMLPSLIDDNGTFQTSAADWHGFSFMHADLFLATCTGQALASLALIDDISFDHMVSA